MRLRLMLTMAAVLVALPGCNDRTTDEDSGTGNMDAGPGTDGGGGGEENTAALCDDGVDNDGDTHADCNDFDCCDLVSCGPTTSCGMRPDGGTPTGMACEGASEPENTTALCSDGCSNDHDDDLFVDCNDYDCCDVRTDCPADTACGMGGGGACPGDPERENTLPRCMDGCSNDHDDDTFVDCDEADCCWVLSEALSRGEAGVEACAAGTFCADTWTPPASASLCADDDLSGPPERENSYERCSDGCSNDRDGFQDCDDFKCCAAIAAAVAAGVSGAAACAAGTACADDWTPREGFPRGSDVNLCAGDDGTGDPPEENTMERCTDECDNDRDGFEDCDDLDCCDVAGVTCGSDTACGGA